MTIYRRAIDDPEVRAQHRTQVRSDLSCLVVGVLAVGIFIFAMYGLIDSGQHAFGTRAPAIVDGVERADGTVSVTSSDPRIPDHVVFEVRDTDAYDIGDRVGVIITGEDHEMLSLDREPVLPLLLEDAAEIAGLAVVVIALGIVPIALLARRRRRALTRPWKWVSAVIFDDDDIRYAYLAEVGGGTYWQLADAGDLSTGRIDAQVAGSSRLLAMRFYGSNQLATGRRRRPLPGWAEREEIFAAQPTGESAMSAPRCMSVGVSEPRSSSSCLASRK